MNDIVIVMEGGRVQDVYSDGARSIVVVDGGAQDGGPYTQVYPGKTLDQIPPWAAHRLRLEVADETPAKAHKLARYVVPALLILAGLLGIALSVMQGGRDAMSEVWAWLDTVPPDTTFYVGCAALLLCAFWCIWRTKP